ncbi:hypothetical protein CCAND38_100043 [Capnocytophaga canis]|uniref:Uncharacterized protein n=1 Tax=Capnocytophaga canis TaxID=1848903 RepID=A0A0B7I0V1_9FLAO|nr:hypothetical protein CCAND38_100043 [Capnocytophaga canis]
MSLLNQEQPPLGHIIEAVIVSCYEKENSTIFDWIRAIFFSFDEFVFFCPTEITFF